MSPLLLSLPAPRSAPTAYLWLQGAWSFLWALSFTLSLVYQVQVAGLSPLQLVLVGTVLEATCFLAEVPTGVIADLRSRKWSVIIGLALIGVGVTLMAWAAFWPIVAAQVVWGVGYTFVSGAAEAWVTDEVAPEPVQPVLTKAHQVSLAMNIVGVLTAGILGLISLGTPIVAGGIGFVVLAALMGVLMGEDNFATTPQQELGRWAHMRASITDGVHAARGPGVVRTFLIIGLLAGLTSEVFDRLWVDRVVNDIGLPSIGGVNETAIWFTLFALVSSLLALAASLLANRLAPMAVNAEQPTRIMSLLALVQVVGVAVFALAGSLWVALTGRWARDAAISIGYPIQRAWLNRHVSSRSRATTLSMMGQADAVGQVVGGPALGAVAGRSGVPIALLIAAALQAPASILYARLRPSLDGPPAAPGPAGWGDRPPPPPGKPTPDLDAL